MLTGVETASTTFNRQVATIALRWMVLRPRSDPTQDSHAHFTGKLAYLFLNYKYMSPSALTF